MGKKIKQLSEKEIKEIQAKQKMLVEYSFITKPGELLLDEDDEPQPDPNQQPAPADGQQPQADNGGQIQSPDMQVPESDPSLEVAPETEVPQPEIPQEDNGEEIEVDVTDLTNDQQEVSNKVDALTSQNDKMLELLSSIIDKVEQNSVKIDSEIDGIKSEIEKRNPTPVELLQKRATLGQPYNETPEQYWDKKQAEGGYKLTDGDEDPEKEYELRASDLQDNPSNVFKSFGLKDDEINQTMKSVLGY